MAHMLEKIQRDKEAILAIANRYHAKNVRIFGSVARGEDHAESDLDLLVDFLPGTTLFDHVALEGELSTRLGCQVDVVSARALNKYLRQGILKDAVKL